MNEKKTLLAFFSALNRSEIVEQYLSVAVFIHKFVVNRYIYNMQANRPTTQMVGGGGRLVELTIKRVCKVTKEAKMP